MIIGLLCCLSVFLSSVHAADLRVEDLFPSDVNATVSRVGLSLELSVLYKRIYYPNGNKADDLVYQVNQKQLYRIDGALSGIFELTDTPEGPIFVATTLDYDEKSAALSETHFKICALQEASLQKILNDGGAIIPKLKLLAADPLSCAKGADEQSVKLIRADSFFVRWKEVTHDESTQILRAVDVRAAYLLSYRGESIPVVLSLPTVGQHPALKLSDTRKIKAGSWASFSVLPLTYEKQYSENNFLLLKE